ncbi:MAG: PD40 domain-containing protein [Deltaproteobacteria bacterium]|nr:PD40 domain-containing protein [Deltaproteobacteria bacterium]
MLVPLLVAAAATSTQSLGYYRWPAIRGDEIVFTAEGDLWRVGASGGVARRLTTHLGTESYAAISPDGRLVAFSAQYEGPTEVYVTTLDGGLPRRLTYDGEPSAVVGFTPDGRVLFRTRKHSTLPKAQLVSIHPDTLERRVLPLYQAAEGAYEGDTLIFTRFEEQPSRNKRYRGGWAQSLWRFDGGASEAVPLTADFPGTSRAPMIWDGRVYFASDRDGTMNLWSMRADGSSLQQLTRHDGLDVKNPSLDRGRIVYQLGADLHLFEVRTGLDRIVPIALASDFDQQRVRWIKDPIELMTAAHLSPKGDRVVLTARGQIVSVPVKKGRIISLGHSSGARARDARFMPDGKSVFALTDASGELDYWRYSADGGRPGEQMTQNHHTHFFGAVPSPDGKWLAYADKERKLWAYDLEKRRRIQVAVSRYDDFSDLAWSADGKWLAYVESAANFFSRIAIWSVQSGKSELVTSDRVESRNPVFSKDGRWLYFLSDRTFESKVPSPWGPRQPEPYLDKPTKIYLLPLVQMVDGAPIRSPFAPEDELHPKEEKNDKNAKDKDKKDDKKPKDEAPPVRIDFGGILDRAIEAPLEAGNYESLLANEERFFVLSKETLFEKKKKSLISYPITNEDPKPTQMTSDVLDIELSLDGKKLLIHKEKKLYVVPAAEKAPDKLEESAVDLAKWTLSIDPKEEWSQMFVEAWRLQRDWFYDPSLHGLDWPATLAKYRPLLARVTERGELSDLVAQMLSELEALHTYVGGGDVRKVADPVEPASLGAELVADPARKGWRVDRIFDSNPDYPANRGPLSKPEVMVSSGEIITAIDGQPFTPALPARALLRNKAGRQVRLSVEPQKGGPARDIIVEPITARAEEDLRYDHWELSRRLETENRSSGKVGYIHLRAMGTRDYAQWAREFFPVFDRPGLVIDVRGNRGGNIDSWLLSRLLRKAWFYWQPRQAAPFWSMQWAFRGQIVVIVDERTASDGEAFAEGIKRLGLGTVIGTRTWGGEIWLSMQELLVDQGIASPAETGVYGPEGVWLIEGHGVVPDEIVDSLPHETFEGRDRPLERALEILAAKIAADPVTVPSAPPYPKKQSR